MARLGTKSGLNTIKKWDTDLNKVCMVNDVSRRLCAGAINTDIVISASIAPMLPGLALTNSVRDILQGDYVSGAGRLLIAGAIAIAIFLTDTVFNIITLARKHELIEK